MLVMAPTDALVAPLISRLVKAARGTCGASSESFDRTVPSTCSYAVPVMMVKAAALAR